MPMEVIEDGITARFAGRGEAGFCSLGEAIAEWMAAYCPTALDCHFESDVEEWSVELELAACEGVPG